MLFVLPAAVALLASSTYAAPPVEPLSIGLDTLYDAIVEAKPEARAKLLNLSKSRMPQEENSSIWKAYQDAQKKIQNSCIPDTRNPNQCAPESDPVYPAAQSYQQTLSKQVEEKRAQMQLECKDLQSPQCRQKRAELELATRVVNAIIDFEQSPKALKEDLPSRRKKLMRNIAEVLKSLQKQARGLASQPSSK